MLAEMAEMAEVEALAAVTSLEVVMIPGTTNAAIERVVALIAGIAAFAPIVMPACLRDILAGRP